MYPRIAASSKIACATLTWMDSPKVNFKMAVMLCREFIRKPTADMEELLKDIARYTVPIRPGRQDQRNLRVKGFPGFVYRVAA